MSALDTTLIGETAAKLMDQLPEEAEGEIVAVGLVVVVDGAGDRSDATYTRVSTSCPFYYEMLGLFESALDVIRSGSDTLD